MTLKWNQRTSSFYESDDIITIGNMSLNYQEIEKLKFYSEIIRQEL